MLNDIKKELIKRPEKIKEVLDHFGYCNIVIRSNYIQCGRDRQSSKKSIVIRLDNNDCLYVTDYARNINCEIFSYIISQRNVEFTEIINVVKQKLGITDYYSFFNKSGVFGGIYERVKKRSSMSARTYSNEVLNHYIQKGNLRFLKDNISLESQNFFNIRYDIESQGIVIPIYDQIGQIIGIKVRCNYEVQDGEQKYYYLIPCSMSQTLYGYCQNYNYIVNNTIYIFEAEKSVMQCHSYGIRNCVALGSGTISSRQIQMLFEANPTRIVFMHDIGYKLESIMRNIEMVKRYLRLTEIEIGYWNYFDKGYSGKSSPSDFGRCKLNDIIENEIKLIGIENEEI